MTTLTGGTALPGPLLGPLSPAGRRYGALRDLHDRRDRVMAPKPGTTAPAVVDLRPWCGPRKDQGALGSCTGQAYSSILEWIQRKYFGRTPVLSPLFLYYMERYLEGSVSEDSGAMPRDGCRVLVKYGCCEESVDPYDISRFAVPPTPAQLANALLWKCGAYHRINETNGALSCMGDPVPWVPSVAFAVFESFESSETARTGVMPVPDVDNERLLGGHEVFAVGYDVGQKPTLRPSHCPPAVLIQNSWGENWGWEGGFFWMPLAVLENADLVQDVWIVHTGGPWK